MSQATIKVIGHLSQKYLPMAIGVRVLAPLPPRRISVKSRLLAVDYFSGRWLASG